MLIHENDTLRFTVTFAGDDIVGLGEFLLLIGPQSNVEQLKSTWLAHRIELFMKDPSLFLGGGPW